MGKKVTLLILFSVCLWAVAGGWAGAAAAQARFKDVPGDHWAWQRIEALVNLNLLQGYGDQTFRPNNIITRAEFVTLLTRAEFMGNVGAGAFRPLQAEDVKLISGRATTFADTATHWVQQQGWLGQAVKLGLVVPGDYQDLEFLPDKPITREEMAVMLVRSLGSKYVEQAKSFQAVPLNNFTDGKTIIPWMRGYIFVAVDKGLIKGYEDQTFRPQGEATRAEASVMLDRRLGAAPTANCFRHH